MATAMLLTAAIRGVVTATATVTAMLTTAQTPSVQMPAMAGGLRLQAFECVATKHYEQDDFVRQV